MQIRDVRTKDMLQNVGDRAGCKELMNKEMGFYGKQDHKLISFIFGLVGGNWTLQWWADSVGRQVER